MEHTPPPPSVLTGLLLEHRRLEDCVRRMDTSPAEVLAAGQALLAFAQQESHAFSVLLRLLDPAVVHEMETEHQEFARDLELLEWLVTTTSESPDAAMLAESLARRMHQHVARDGRLLARAAVLVSR